MVWHPDVKSLSVGGHHFALVEQGKGEAVVLIHGITTFSFIWRKPLPFLPDNKRVVAYDLLGCGGSDMPLDVDYSLNGHTERLLKMLQQLGIERVHLVGHDVGGGIAQIFAVQHPEMVIDLCLINSVGYGYWPVQPIKAMQTPILRRFVMAALDIGAFKLIVQRGLYHKDHLDAELLELFSKPMQSPVGRAALMHFARCLDNHNLTDIAADLQQLVIPVLVIRGEADSYLSEEISLRLKREIPGCRLLRIQTGGHYIQEDEPVQVAKALSSFWNRDVVVGAVS